MRIALGIEYQGTSFKGWQFQPQLPTIQGHLQNALAIINRGPVQLFCAGRTDAGVHAAGQVVHFNTEIERPLSAWVIGTNTYLPKEIAVQWAHHVPDDFHARFSALSRHYRYLIYNVSARPALLIERATWQYAPLNIEAMQQASNYLLGEHDFSSFRSAECESPSPMRNVSRINIQRKAHLIVIDIEANAFLHHMVRNIVGVLVRIGRGSRPPEWMQAVLDARDRRQAAETASPNGLYLFHVHYPAQYELPQWSFNGLF